MTPPAAEPRAAPQALQSKLGTAAPPASLPLRVAAMVYDGVLLFGIAFVTGLALLMLTGWTAPLSSGRRLVLQCAVFVAFGVYFGWCWIRSGQTLALKTWHLRVVDAGGRNPSAGRAVARYVLSWTLFLPGLAYITLMHPPPAASLAALAVGFVLTLLPALFDRERRLLHDRLSRTRIVRAT
ncbi:MAG TPA: RDD family protein [Burkholderiaceae bacterium]|nr:RDD family protein [Burkholderiaceae bacterium]HQR72639.1 RDD family protein [Burkholderiaceae bacterium]